MIEIMSRFDITTNTGHYNTTSGMFKCNNNNINNNNRQQQQLEGNNVGLLPSQTISSESKTPYTDATQVSFKVLFFLE